MRPMTVIIEACVDSVESALAAKRGGADRLELCENLAVGGTTPSAALIADVRARTGLPVMVMIRPRGGSYVYSVAEIDQMQRDIDTVRACDIEGLVIGILDARSGVDVARTRELVLLAGPKAVTFHRAFDCVPDREVSLEALIAAGVTRVLTSGGAPTALAGANALARLVARAGRRIRIMAGGNVRGSNVHELVATSGVTEVHARCELDETQIRAIVNSF